MNFYLGVTDTDWFNYLSHINPEDINFWQPGGKLGFRVIQPGEPFIFKLKKPNNAIAGVGFFSSQSFLPISMAWEIFKDRNGVASFEEFYQKIHSLRNPGNSLRDNPNIGCIVLTNPVFFKREDWIPVPSNWSSNLQGGKSYSTDESIGKNLWVQIEATLLRYNVFDELEGAKNQLILEEPRSQYGISFMNKIRLGQGAFRVLVTDAYTRKCAISGERTLPVLDACHIKPYARSGPHFISNGLLLRSDIHKLFDNGYVTVNNKLIVEVSRRIKEEYENGREYYKFHGKPIATLPSRQDYKPSGEYLEWHNGNVFKG